MALLITPSRPASTSTIESWQSPPTLFSSSTLTAAANLTTPAGVIAYLAPTEFAAVDVETLSGGMSAFTYRVTLRTPRPYRTVVVKHSLDCASSDKSVMLSADRMTFEYEALMSVADSGLVTSESVVQVPRVLFYDATTHTLVMEDLAPARSLSSVLMEAFEAGTIESVSDQIGEPLGDFMGRLHSWSAQPGQEWLRKRFSENISSKEIASRIRYDLALRTAEKYGMKKGWMETFVEQGMEDSRKGGDVVIIGDFWVENILVSTGPELRIYVIDWETARCGRAEADVGDIAAAVHSIDFIHRHTSSDPKFMQSFMRGYNMHRAVDEVQVAFSAGRNTMSFGADMPWTESQDEDTRKEIVGYGLKLLEAGLEWNVEDIQRNPVVRSMFATR